MQVLKVAYDGGGGEKSSGAKYGPNAVEAQFKKWPWRTFEDGSVCPEAEFANISANAPEIKGEAPPLLRGYFAASDLILSLGERFMTLSGDNSCSFHTVKAVAKHFPDPHLVLLDAHFDACDLSHDPHASWVRRVWEERIVSPKKTFFFGVRDPEKPEADYVKSKGAVIVSCDDLRRVGASAIVSNLLLFGELKVKSALVMVVDIDVLDPAYAPGTGVLRSGGLDVRQVMEIVRIFGELPFKFKVGEISEVIPHEGDQLRSPWDKRSDPCGLTVLAAEAILRQMLHSFC